MIPVSPPSARNSKKAPLEVHKDTRLGVLGLLLVKAARSQDFNSVKHNRRNHDLPLGSFR